MKAFIWKFRVHLPVPGSIDGEAVTSGRPFAVQPVDGTSDYGIGFAPILVVAEH